jgi:hypothetical protein
MKDGISYGVVMMDESIWAEKIGRDARMGSLQDEVRRQTSGGWGTREAGLSKLLCDIERFSMGDRAN